MQVSANTLKAVQALAVHMINNPINGTSVVEWLIENDPMVLVNALGLTVDYECDRIVNATSEPEWYAVLPTIVEYCKADNHIAAIKALRQYSSDRRNLKTLSLVDAKRIIYYFMKKDTWWSMTDEQQNYYRDYFGNKDLTDYLD